MKKHLIVSLDLEADVLALKPIIEALSTEAQVSLMTIDRHGKMAKTLSKLEHVYLIQLEEISKYKKHRIFSDLEMFRELANNLEAAMKVEWDEVINLSNSESAHYLVNCFKAKEYKGLRYTKERTLYSDQQMGAWIQGPTSFSQTEINWELSGRKNKWSPTPAPRHEIKTWKVGIELASSQAKNHLSLSTLKELIESLLKNPQVEVKVIATPSFKQEKYFYELNEKLGHKLEIFEQDAETMATEVSQFNYIFSTSKTLKTACAEQGIYNLSLWTNINDLYKEHTGENSLSLLIGTDTLALLKGESLASIVHHHMNGHYQEYLRLPPGIEVYTAKADNMLIPLSYHYNKTAYLSMLMEKALWREVNYQSWIEMKKYLKGISDRDLSSFLNREKESLSVVVKTSLNAIRYLKNHEQGPGQVKELMSALDLLMNKRKEGATYFLLNLFKHRMEHLGATDKEDNLIKTEKALITLKNQLSTLTKILGDMAETINERRKLPLSKEV